MAKKPVSLYPYREATLTPLMKTIMIVGSVIFTIAMFILMNIPSFA